MTVTTTLSLFRGEEYRNRDKQQNSYVRPLPRHTPLKNGAINLFLHQIRFRQQRNSVSVINRFLLIVRMIEIEIIGNRIPSRNMIFECWNQTITFLLAVGAFYQGMNLRMTIVSTMKRIQSHFQSSHSVQRLLYLT